MRKGYRWAVVVATLMSGACTDRSPHDAKETAPRLALKPCRVPDVAQAVECGTLQVPENRSKPDGRQIPIRVVRLPSIGPEVGGPVFYFEGGPGESAVESASYIAGLWIRRGHDVVLIEQRGTGTGKPLDCRLDGADDNLQAYMEPPTEALRACPGRLAKSADLTQYTTYHAMQDADQVRRALGYDRINLHGASYGSRAAIVYMRMYPAHVRAAYLSGVVPIDLKMPLNFPRASQRALDELFRRCASDRACRTAYPHPARDLRIVLDRLASPAPVKVRHPSTGAPIEIAFSKWAFGQALLGKMYELDAVNSVPKLLHEAALGDLSGFAALQLAIARKRQTSLRWGMHRAVTCSEDTGRIDAAEIEPATRATFLDANFLRQSIRSCEPWPRASYPPDFFAPRRLAIPVLMTAGRFDPATPPFTMEMAYRDFPNSVRLVIPQGHHFTEEGCVASLGSRFLATADLKSLDFVCAREPANDIEVIR